MAQRPSPQSARYRRSAMLTGMQPSLFGHLPTQQPEEDRTRAVLQGDDVSESGSSAASEPDEAQHADVAAESISGGVVSAIDIRTLSKLKAKFQKEASGGWSMDKFVDELAGKGTRQQASSAPSLPCRARALCGA